MDSSHAAPVGNRTLQFATTECTWRLPVVGHKSRSERRERKEAGRGVAVQDPPVERASTKSQVAAATRQDRLVAAVSIEPRQPDSGRANRDHAPEGPFQPAPNPPPV